MSDIHTLARELSRCHGSSVPIQSHLCKDARPDEAGRAYGLETGADLLNLDGGVILYIRRAVTDVNDKGTTILQRAFGFELDQRLRIRLTGVQ